MLFTLLVCLNHIGCLNFLKLKQSDGYHIGQTNVFLEDDKKLLRAIIGIRKREEVLGVSIYAKLVEMNCQVKNSQIEVDLASQYSDCDNKYTSLGIKYNISVGYFELCYIKNSANDILSIDSTNKSPTECNPFLI
jgi:hypothetical protein